MRTSAVAAAIAAVAFPCFARAEFEGVLVSRMTGAANGTTRTLISRDGIRTETELQLPAGSPAATGKTIRTVVIVRKDKPNVTYFLDDTRKTYSVFEYQPGSSPESTTFTAKRIGPDTVAGFPCERVAVTNSHGNESELCVSSAFLGGDSWLRAFQAREQDRERGLWKALRDAGVRGFPIRWSSSGMKGQGGFTMELVSAHRQSVPASSFAIPSGYTKTEPGAAMTSPEAAKKLEEEMKKMPPEQRARMEELMKRLGKGKD